MQRPSTIAAGLALLLMGLTACNATAPLSSREQRIIAQLPVAPEKLQEESLPGCTQVVLPPTVSLATYPATTDLIVVFAERGHSALCVGDAHTVLRKLDVPIPPTTDSPLGMGTETATSSDDDPVPLHPGQRANGDDDPVPLRPGQQAQGDDDPVPLHPGQRANGDDDPVPLRPGQQAQGDDDPVPLHPGQRANGDDDPVPLRPGQQAQGDDDPVPLHPKQGQ